MEKMRDLSGATPKLSNFYLPRVATRTHEFLTIPANSEGFEYRIKMADELNFLI
jgi:hypothetical protein